MKRTVLFALFLAVLLVVAGCAPSYDQPVEPATDEAMEEVPTEEVAEEDITVDIDDPNVDATEDEDDLGEIV